jgi:triacylglycerol lipase
MRELIKTLAYKQNMTYKQATIALAVTLGALLVLLVVVYEAVVKKRLASIKRIKDAIKTAADNDLMCDEPGVICDFEADRTVQPPVPTEQGYSSVAAKFGAQLVAILEYANLDYENPVPLPNTTVLTMLNGINDNKTSDPDNDRLQHIGWILKVDNMDEIWVVFRGTQTKPEWSIDFSLNQVGLGGDVAINVHEGFYNAYLELQSQIVDVLRTNMTPNTVVYVAGHSLGAALSVFCAANLATSKDLPISDVRLYAFAPPKVGNQAFVDFVRNLPPVKELNLIANDADIVPLMPLAVQPNTDNPDQPYYYAQFPLLTFNANWGSWVHNHVMPVYIAHLDLLSKQCVTTQPAARMAIARKPGRRAARHKQQRDILGSVLTI